MGINLIPIFGRWDDLYELVGTPLEDSAFALIKNQLDSDLAKLYWVETKRINEAVKNNLIKFPERFSFTLSESETFNCLRSKFSTSNNIHRGGRRYIPRVFTEHGVAMLATILKSKTATVVSIRIMDALVEMRKYINSSLIEQKYINEMILKNNKRIGLLEESFDKMKEKTKVSTIFYEYVKNSTKSFYRTGVVITIITWKK